MKEYQKRLDEARKKRMEERRKERILERKAQRKIEKEEKEVKDKEDREIRGKGHVTEQVLKGVFHGPVHVHAYQLNPLKKKSHVVLDTSVITYYSLSKTMNDQNSQFK